jgi:asparagine synthase (glutamine-hydrolysing)
MAILGFAGRWPESIDAQAQLQYVKARAAQTSATASAPHQQTPAGLVFGPFVHSAQGVTIAVSGKPVHPASEHNESAHDPAALLHAVYSKQGRGFLGALTGSFALAILDENAGLVLLAIDRMGIERMTWASVGDAIAFGESAESVAHFPAINAGIRRQGLHDFLMLHMVPAPHTIFEGVQKLRPATALVFQRGRAEVFAYWKPEFEERKAASFSALRDDVHAALDAAVRDCKPGERTGSFLSGGLDSSTVSGKLAKVGNGRARTFSMGFGVDAYDELKYADIAARHFGCDAFQYHVTSADVVTAFPLIANAYDEPFGNSSAVPTYFCALRARERGITHLLAGDGGDEIFGGNERYARHKIFDAYFHLPAVIRRNVLEPLAPHLPGEDGFKPLSKLRSYIQQASIPLPERLETWNLVYRESATMLDPEFARSVDQRAPFHVMSDVYSAAPARSTLNKMLYYDWHFTLADSDLRKVGTMCALAGVEVSYPMLDARVVDVSNRVTPGQKMRRLELRSFYKDAMRGFLPDAILDKTKHGFGLPFGDWLRTDARLADMINSHLSNLKSRRIVRPEFIDRLIADQRTGHAMYYGYAIWDLAMLEAWLQARGARV